jgi:hypothetical protein
MFDVILQVHDPLCYFILLIYLENKAKTSDKMINGISNICHELFFLFRFFSYT